MPSGCFHLLCNIVCFHGIGINPYSSKWLPQFYAIFITVLSSFCILVVGMYLRQVFSIEIGEIFYFFRCYTPITITTKRCYLSYIWFFRPVLCMRMFTEEVFLGTMFQVILFPSWKPIWKNKIIFLYINPSVTLILLFYDAHMLIKFQMLFYLYPSCFVKMSIIQERLLHNITKQYVIHSPDIFIPFNLFLFITPR